MSRTHTFLLIVACIVFGTTPALAAGAPSTVSSVEAGYENGKLTVRWSPAKDVDSGIAFYRVYFSRKSILDTQGDWEDFERTQGPETVFTFDQPPYPGKKIFVSVLAINNAGVESEGFEAEAFADPPVLQTSATSSSLSASVSSSSASVSSSTATSAPTTLALTDASPLSSTGIVLWFNTNLQTEPAIPHTAFIIVDASGSLLPILHAETSGATIILTTQPQQPEKVYILGLLQDIQANDGSILPSSSPQVPFYGFRVEQKALSSSSSSSTRSSSASSARSQGTALVGSVYGINPGLRPPAGPFVSPVAQNTSSGTLTNSGAGLFSLLTLSGGLAGFRLQKKRKAQKIA